MSHFLLLILSFLIYYFLFCVYECFADMHGYAQCVCAPGAQGGQVLDALKPELEMIMDHVDAEDMSSARAINTFNG